MRNYFVLGSKLIGFYCLVLSMMHFVPVVFSIFDASEYPREESEYYRIIFVFSILTPILLAVVGVYLMRCGLAVHHLAFGRYRTTSGRTSDVFTLCIKLYGLYLAAITIPDLLKLLAKLLLVVRLPYNFENTVVDATKFETNLLPFLVMTLVGMYFVVWGETVTRLVSRTERNVESEAQP